MSDLHCLFWNTSRKAPHNEIVALAKDTNANLVALVEYAGSERDLLKSFSAAGLGYFAVPQLACPAVHLFTTFDPALLEARTDQARYTIKEYFSPGEDPVLLCVAHLPSRLHYSASALLYSATLLKSAIERVEQEAGHSNTILFGDLNLDPFDDGMLQANALNAVPSLATAQRLSREHQGEPHSYFYNPMWNLLGDFVGPAGTFFHDAPGIKSHFWTMLDQVIMRPGMATRFARNSLRILTAAGTTSLLKLNGRPQISDHFPLTFSYSL